MTRVPNNIKRGLLTPTEKEQIVELAERGWSSGRIAGRLNRHPATVSYAMHRLGVRTLVRRDFSYVRKGVVVKSFSAEEDALVLELRTRGLPTTKIAPIVSERFGHRRSAHTIGVRLVLLSNV